MSNKVELKGNVCVVQLNINFLKTIIYSSMSLKDWKVLTVSMLSIKCSRKYFKYLKVKFHQHKTSSMVAVSCYNFLCNKCGSYIYTDYESAIGRLNVRTKTLEKSEEFPPQAHIFTKDKDEWVNLSNINNCFQKMYDPKETWPKESLTRIKDYIITTK
jgi:hypothetical protein